MILTHDEFNFTHASQSERAEDMQSWTKIVPVGSINALMDLIIFSGALISVS